MSGLRWKEGRECSCRHRCTQRCGLREVIDAAKSRVESMLPEDEPDFTCAWIYRVAIENALIANMAQRADGKEEERNALILAAVKEEGRNG